MFEHPFPSCDPGHDLAWMVGGNSRRGVIGRRNRSPSLRAGTADLTGTAPGLTPTTHADTICGQRG